MIGANKTRTTRAQGTRRRLSKPPVAAVSSPLGASFATLGNSPNAVTAAMSGVFAPTLSARERFDRSGALVHWVAAGGNEGQRRALAKDFKARGEEVLLVHHISRLPREQVGAFVNDYFAENGSITAVTEWLRLAGAHLRAVDGPKGKRRAVSKARARGGKSFWSSLGNIFEDIVGSIVDAVESVVDAVISAGKALVDVVREAVSWTLAQLTDLVEGLVRAGKKVAEILAAAVAHGLQALKSFVEAVLAAGRSLSSVVLWAVAQAAATANAVVSKLLALGRKVLDIVVAVATAGAAAVASVVKALLAAGKTLANLLSAMVGQGLSVVKALVEGLLSAGQALRAVLSEASKLAASAFQRVLEALLALGKGVGAMLVEMVALGAAALKSAVKALLALGQSVARVLSAIAAQAAAVVKAVVNALLAAGTTLAAIVQAAVLQTSAIAAAIFRALLALGKRVTDIVTGLVGRAVSALRTAFEALLAMGIAVGVLVTEIVRNVAEGFRAGFFQGLIAAGKSMLTILKAAVEVSVSIALLAFAVILELCGGYGPLTAAERLQATRIFGASIDLDRVKVGFATLPRELIEAVNGELKRAFTTMYLINFGPGAVRDMATIIHELVHVWQGVQTGPLYMTRALEAQLTAGLDSLFHKGKYDDSAAYVVTPEMAAANGGDLSKFNPEQQAWIVEQYWIGQYGGADLEAGLPVEVAAPYARAVYKATKKRTKDALPARRGRVGAKRLRAA